MSLSVIVDGDPADDAPIGENFVEFVLTNFPKHFLNLIITGRPILFDAGVKQRVAVERGDLNITQHFGVGGRRPFKAEIQGDN
jgi:hypothetical protein